MSIWIAIWIFLSAALLYFFGWTMYITMRQKRVWKAFADTHKLRYKDGSLADSPTIEGEMDGYPISVFSSEHLLDDPRQRTRKMTAIELRLNTIIPADGGVGSGDMVRFLKDLNGFDRETRPDHTKWKNDYIAIGESRGVLKEYLTTDRLDALTSLMGLKNMWVILVYRGDMALLRIDTPKPLEQPKLLEKIVRKLIKTAQVLELKDGESAALKIARTRQSEKETALDPKVKDGDLDVGGLELEE